MAKLKEVRTAMSCDFVEKFRESAENLGMTHRQLAAVCISLGYKALCVDLPVSLPSEPPPVSAVEIAENAAVSRVAEGDDAKRRLPFTLKAAFGAISRK